MINVTFKTSENNSDLLIVSLYEKSSQSGLENAIYFNGLEKTEDDTYTFTIKRSQLREILGVNGVDGCTLVLNVTANGVSNTDVAETVYHESVYTITYHLNGGVNNTKNPDVYSIYSDIVILYMPQREHYLFGDWFMTPDFREGTNDSVIDCSIAKNIDVYARWEIEKHTVRYTAGAADSFEDQISRVEYGSITPEFEGEPTREGYTFVGWDKEISETVEGDVVYTAVWSKNHVHEPILIEGVEPTCFAPGYRSYYECVNCGYFEEEECTTRILDIEAWKKADGQFLSSG